MGAVNLGVQPLLENAFADCFLAVDCAVPAPWQYIYVHGGEVTVPVAAFTKNKFSPRRNAHENYDVFDIFTCFSGKTID